MYRFASEIVNGSHEIPNLIKYLNRDHIKNFLIPVATGKRRLIKYILCREVDQPLIENSRGGNDALQLYKENRLILHYLQSGYKLNPADIEGAKKYGNEEEITYKA